MRGADTENGAGIATDPTLTVAWSRLPANRPTSAWRPVFSRALATRAGQRFCHRRSRRHPGPLGSRTVRRPCVPRQGARDRTSWRPVFSNGMVPTEVFPVPRSPTGHPARVDMLGDPLDRPFRVRASPCHGPSSNIAWTDVFTPNRFEIAFAIRWLDLQSKTVSGLFDVPRMRPPTELRKGCKTDLSTFPGIRGGQEWITLVRVRERE